MQHVKTAGRTTTFGSRYGLCMRRLLTLYLQKLGVNIEANANANIGGFITEALRNGHTENL